MPRRRRMDAVPEQVGRRVAADDRAAGVAGVHEPVGGADAEQVHDDGLQRDDDRAEDHEQKDEAQGQDKADDDGQVAVHRVDVVDRTGRAAAGVDIRRDVIERGGEVVAAQAAEGVHRLGAGRIAVEEDLDVAGIAVLAKLERAHFGEGRVIRDRLAEAGDGEGDIGGAGVSVDHDIDGVDAAR